MDARASHHNLGQPITITSTATDFKKFFEYVVRMLRTLLPFLQDYYYEKYDMILDWKMIFCHVVVVQDFKFLPLSN